MKCPFCSTPDTRVIDSRLANESNQVRRRRVCGSCDSRFTTYETLLLNMPMVVKSDQAREPFDDVRLRSGMQKALEKRPISIEQIEGAVNHVKKQLLALDAREVASRTIGEMVMHELQKLDHVAYIRFASVYLSFEDLQSFQELITRLEQQPTPEMQRSQIPLINDE